MIKRTFQDIPEGKLSEADRQSYLVDLGWSGAMTWENLLRSSRVLMISEAGAGKTYECREQAKRLWAAGEPAFFIELAALATGDLRSQLDGDEEVRLDAWLSSQSDIATYFLDSIDELKLTLGSFEQALKRLKKGIDAQLGRARIVTTTRPTAFDERLLRDILPVPPVSTSVTNEEAFANFAMGAHPTQQAGDEDDNAPDWRKIALMPLSDSQIAEFAKDQGIDEPAALLDDLKRRNAQEFARRPQDLIELCADWRDHKRIRTHRDQVAANVRVKLQPRDNGREPAELSADKAIEGASRLALAMLVMRRMTIRHSAASDIMDDEAALDPASILSDWNPNERKALLERPLFGFASYGRVRFHHRSVAEYLAAERLKVLRGRGVPVSALKRLLFAQTKGKTIVRPSRRPIAGWLALAEDSIFEMLRDNEPAVLLNEGDPESLSQLQRNQALRAYAERYGQGGWRRLRVPDIQINRFATPELADEIGTLWLGGIENPDVRLTLLELVEAARIGACADIAYRVACEAEAYAVERMSAIDALVAIGDPRLEEIASDIAAENALWPDDIAHGVVLRLFPRDLSIEQLCQVLSWIKQKRRGSGDLSWHLPHLIAEAGFDLPHLEALRDGLVDLLSDGLSWPEEQTNLVCHRAHLSGALAATCMLGLDRGKPDGWLHAAVLALRLHHRRFTNDKPYEALRERLTNLTAEENARLFWAEDSLIRSLRAIADPWQRFAEIALKDGPVELRADRDLDWIKEALGDTARSTDDRTMLLEAAMHLAPNSDERSTHVSGLKPLVADQPDLIAVIDNRLKPSEHDERHKRWEKKAADQKKQRERRVAKTKAKWIQFWREIAGSPDSAFSSGRSFDTAWNLWRAMSRDGEYSRASGWNRRFIEEHFGTEIADRLRRTLMKIWREDPPTISSERQEDQRGTYARWQLGLAGLYAEAEDPSWATKLSDEEAKLAARHAPIDHNWLPHWMESLVDAHPAAVDAILGKALNSELNREPLANGHSKLLQDIVYAPQSVASIFLPRLGEWLDQVGDAVDLAGGPTGAAERLRQIIRALLRHGDKEMRAHVGAVARRRLQNDLREELALVWLPTLMQVDPNLGVSALEDRIRSVAPTARSEAVKWFSVLFGDHRDAINLKNPEFSPQLLLRLLRLAYSHVRIDDDAHHEDAYTPDTRDRAETARNMIVNALLDAKGEDGWMAKLEMVDDPLCAHFKHRILAVAEEHWAQELDSVAFDEQQALALDKKGEAPASTNEAMFAIMNDRLDDLDDLLLTDTSPREAWANIADEKLLRREIARELRHAANDLYTVDQEAVTADEKETDIRLRSFVSAHEAVIELKRADNRSIRDLSDTIFHQLVTKYMAAETSRSGCLLIALARDRKWKHPDGEEQIDVPGLMSLLRDEAKRVEEKMGSAVRLSVHLLDLRARLPPECEKK